MRMGLILLNSPKGKCLRQTSASVDDIETQVLPFIDEAISIAAKADGIGLAGPQMGVMYRWYVDKIGKVYINPEIVEAKDTVRVFEGCLSLHNHWYSTERSSIVVLKFQNVDGVEETLRFSGISAWVAQHELDHLNGILVSDHGDRVYKGDERL